MKRVSISEHVRLNFLPLRNVKNIFESPHLYNTLTNVIPQWQN